MRYLILFLFTISCGFAHAMDRKHPHYGLASAVSMGATVNSSVADLRDIDNASVQFIWYSGSTPVGAVNIQGSNQVVSSATSVASWTDLSTSIYAGSAAVSGNTGSVLFNLANTGYRWIRAVYTRTSGSGTIDINFNGKGI